MKASKVALSLLASSAFFSAYADKTIHARNECSNKLFVHDTKGKKDRSTGPITRYPHNSIYWFGDSLNDTGNLKALRPNLAVNSNFPLPNGEVIKERINDTGRQSNGLVQADFLADALGYTLFTASHLKCLSKGSGNFFNFSIGGASLTNNTHLYLEQESVSLGIAFQIEQLCSLLEKSKRSIESDDICVIQSTANDILILMLLILGIPGNLTPTPSVEEYIGNYLDSAVDTISTLYNKGCRRLFVQVLDAPLPDFPLFTKVNNNFPGILDNLNKSLQLMQEGLEAAINLNAAMNWPDLDVTIINDTASFKEIQKNPNLLGLRQTIKPQTMTDLGWPEALAQNVVYFDDAHPTQHTHKILSDFASNWFATYDSQQAMTGSTSYETKDLYMNAQGINQ